MQGERNSVGTVYAIGIDFGTANSCVAHATYSDRGKGEVDPDPLHRPEVVPFHNRDIVPTAMHLGDGRGQPPTFGVAAEERAQFDPLRYYTGFKLHLCRPDTGPDAYLMTKYFLGYLRRGITPFVPLDNLPPGDRIETIVGHPVQWTPDQREATLRAARDAGFPNVRLEEESLAALYCHIFDERSGFRPKAGSHILTIDMGGGTTDFAFLEIPNRRDQRPISIPVHPAPEGPRSYGGRDLDMLLFSYLSRHWDPEIVKARGRVLLQEVRRFKEGFSNHMSDGMFEYESMVLVGDTSRRLRLTRGEFERVAEHYIDHFEVLVRGALAEAKLRPEQVTQLILTGGHSRWYWVERTIGRVFPQLFVGHNTIFRHQHPEQSVARGLTYDPLVRSRRHGFLTPMRRAAHAIWLHVPGRVPVQVAADGKGKAETPAAPEPVLLVPRGQLLPYKTETPVRFQVEQVASDGQEIHVRIQFLSGQWQIPLADRVATFQRTFWEQVAKSIASRLPFAGPKGLDRFEIALNFHIDEHELIHAELAVVRYVGGKPSDVKREQLRLNVPAALGEITV